jgi:glycine reductase complex component B subunit gamma
MGKELERAGFPVAHICTMTPIALMVGSNRIIPAAGIVHPLGNVELEGEAEKALRRTIIEGALKALQTDLSEQRLFPSPYARLS